MATRDPLRLPSYVEPERINKPDAATINRLENTRQTDAYSGFSEIIPIVYGEQEVAGPRLVDPWPSGSGYIWATAISKGPIAAITQVRVKAGEWQDLNQNNTTSLSVPGTGVTIYRRYMGDQSSVDATLAAAIAGFADTYVGTAFVVVGYVPQTGDTELPEVQFRVRGRKCLDPRRPSGDWTAVNAGFGGSTIRALTSSGTTSANRTILAGGDDGKLASQQGTGSWEMRAGGFGTSAVLAVNNANNSNWAAAGASGSTARGVNASANSWVQLGALSGWGDMLATAFRSNTHVVGGTGGRAATRSTSGTSWTAVDAGFGTSAIRAAHASTSLLVLAGDDGKIATSINGSAWTLRDSGLGASAIRALGGSGDSVLAAGDGGMLASSTNGGETWTVSASPFGAGVGITAVAVAEGRFVLASDDGRFAVNVGGWRVHPSPLGGVIRAMVEVDGRLYVAGDGGLMASGYGLDGAYWTENPALHMRDFVTAPWGLRREPVGFDEAADACDSLYSGVPRARTGLCIQDPMSEREALQLLQTYAEVFWGYRGDAIRVVPDIAATNILPMIPANQIIYNSVKLTCAAASEVPTQVSVYFTDRGDASGWATRPETDVAPDDASQGYAATRSDLRLPGVYRRTEARRRAVQRRLALQATGRISWQMMGLGVQYSPGDVVPLPNIRGLRNALVRITAQPEMIGRGVYQMQGTLYSASLYPSDGGGTAIPVGGIVPYTGSLPTGYAAWARSGFLVGDAVGGQALAAAGANANVVLQDVPDHVGPTVQNTNSFYRPPPGSGQVTVTANAANTPRPAGRHGHTATFDRASMLGALPEERLTWAKKTGAPGTLQAGIGFLSAHPISQQRIMAVMTAAGRYLSAGAAAASRPRRNTVTGTTSEVPDHMHGDPVEVAAGTDNVYLIAEGGRHRHQAYANIDIRLRSRRLVLYRATDEALIARHGMIGWEDGAPPAGWAICDGSNGTTDMRGFFVELCVPDDAGQIASETSQARITNVSTDVAGAHGQGSNKSGVRRGPAGVGGGAKQHEFDPSLGHAHSGPNTPALVTNVLPDRRTFCFIQYVGA